MNFIHMTQKLNRVQESGIFNTVIDGNFFKSILSYTEIPKIRAIKVSSSKVPSVSTSTLIGPIPKIRTVGEIGAISLDNVNGQPYYKSATAPYKLLCERSNKR